jgi:phospholipid N-methyltransferase
MSLTRIVRPEMLDQLSPLDPVALELRNDLKFINSLLPSASFVARALLQRFPSEPPRVLIDMGAGDGSFMLRVARRLAPRWKNATVILLDQSSVVDSDAHTGFAALNWKVEVIEADMNEYLRQLKPSSVDAIVANLVLHHFRDEQLRTLLDHVARTTSLFVACEPRRSKLALRVGYFLWVVNCKDITTIDVATSIWAGFRNKELPALWPTQVGWQLHERFAWPFLQCFTATRAT